MGHRLSKTTITDGGSDWVNNNNNNNNNDKKSKRSSIKADKINSKKESNNTSALNLEPSSSSSSSSSSGPTINVITDTKTFCFATSSESSSSSNGPRQIIIKIKLAKMEAGENDLTSTTSSAAVTLDDSSTSTISSNNMETNNNLNVERSNATVSAISFQRNIACDQGNEIKLSNLNSSIAGSSMMIKKYQNNNFSSNFTAVPLTEKDVDELGNRRNINIMVGNCQIINNVSDSRQGSGSSSNNNYYNDSTSNRSSTSNSEFSDAMSELVEEESSTATLQIAATICAEDCKNHCCRQKKSSPAFSSSSSSAYPSKWMDAFKKLRPGCSKKQANQLPSSSTNQQRSEMQPLAAAIPNQNSHLALWSPDVIIPLASSPQIVVVQYPTASPVVALGAIANHDQHAIRLLTGDLPIPTTPESTSSMSVSPCSTGSSATLPNGTIVHSQVDYMHWLVPDLEKITKSSYYWGKMDRYEAERLLEGKPEGTFLLRDSAQEEYLFSVTFRKYGRSLHARIEQFNHEFSFDCHDPGVFTAPTVTGLLEHYKDPTIVMFFEPMLTYPLHRNKTFSLQQLCRATIVSQTTYDGISELEIPLRLKSYLKEYHYKQRVRVKPFDESLYNCA